MNIESFKDPSQIPNSIKFGTMIALFIATLTMGYFFDTSDQISQLETLQNAEADLKNTWLDKKKQAVNLHAHEQQLADIEIAFGTLLRQLPNKSEMDALLNDINQAGLGRGLNFELFRPATAEVTTEYYAEQPVSIIISGNFNDIGSFAEDISRLSRIVNLTDINLKNTIDPVSIAKGVPARINMEATVKTYRYLDDKNKSKKK